MQHPCVTFFDLFATLDIPDVIKTGSQHGDGNLLLLVQVPDKVLTY